ncbi:MAG: sulfatase-like hydrolase/transferase, partial [Rhodospirillaceae bacterium]|nr:sulfatase-like hydrolase/transferase [Rhodospirillaceae bacterium]
MAKRPNFLFIMADQLAPQILPAYRPSPVRTPHLDRLAEDGVVFENAYCTFPLCAPARFSLLSGRLPSRIGAFD